MTDINIDKLTGRELDAAVGEALGWETIDEQTPFRYVETDGCLIREKNSGITGIYRFDKVVNFGLRSNIPRDWFPHRDLNACRVAEMEIERRGLISDYVRNLHILAYNEIPSSIKPYGMIWTQWCLCTADAETRCRAMIKTLLEVKS